MKLSMKFVSFLTAGMLCLTACNSDSNSNSTSTASDSGGTSNANSKMADTGSSNSMNNNNSSAASANPDQAAIDYMVPKNMMEIAWLMAGIHNGTSKELKEHATMMLADHKKLGDKVKALITSKSLTMPAVDTAGAVSIMDAKGKDWDKAWANQMVKDHSKINDDLKEVAAKT